MKLGLYASIANPPNGDHMDRCVQETLTEAEHAEACGFSGFFFGEHHQDKDGFLPSPLVVAAAAAARTSTIEIGTSVILLPLHHPIRVAEDLATLDAIAGGRARLGVGLGYQPADFDMFGIDASKRVEIFEECMAVLRHCFSGERFSYTGKHYQVENVRMTPRPIAQPTPIWIGAWAPQAVRRAGALGDAWVIGPSASLSDVEPLVDVYHEAAARAGVKPKLVLMRDGWVANTRREADEVYGPEVMTAYQYYWQNRALAFQGIESKSAFTLENLAVDRIIMGTPEDCVEQLKRWQQVIGADEVMLRLRHAHSGGPPHARIMNAIELFGREVIPAL
ncbi:MAG: LLM class flavin-dependent oxidoreductase [Chromatiales bacterium]|jgi:probable F420-dependent oxidoreductase|nr:LLM class flavin-dependent oxidoreductase [Chromatiales bacterium]